MGVLDQIVQVGDQVEMTNNNWIGWDHFLIPNKPKWLRDILRNIMFLMIRRNQKKKNKIFYDVGYNIDDSDI